MSHAAFNANTHGSSAQWAPRTFSELDHHLCPSFFPAAVARPRDPGSHIHGSGGLVLASVSSRGTPCYGRTELTAAEQGFIDPGARNSKDCHWRARYAMHLSCP